MLKSILLSICICNIAFGYYFNTQWDMRNPPTLEQSLESLLQIDCQQVEFLKGIGSKSQYKGEKAIAHCLIEQKLIKAIIEDDTHTYTLLKANEQCCAYFLFYTTQTPRFIITPLMAAIVFNASKVFELILADSDKSDMFSTKKPFYDINRVISDIYIPLRAFKLGDSIYDVHGVSALDLSAMYHRYSMFWALLKKGAEYNNPKYPLTNGIITFGDIYILELMLHFDESFLYRFAGGKILHIAARDGNVGLLEYLITHKHLPVDSLKSGQTPLDWALNTKNQKPQLQSAKKLIELGAKVSQANRNRLNKLNSK